jgi:hypothetical protein
MDKLTNLYISATLDRNRPITDQEWEAIIKLRELQVEAALDKKAKRSSNPLKDARAVSLSSITHGFNQRRHLRARGKCPKLLYALVII